MIRLVFTDKELLNDPAVKRWKEEIEEILNEQIHQFASTLMAHGTATLPKEEEHAKILHHTR